MSIRQFELQDGTSDKFWTIAVEGSDYEVNFGRSGTKGQTQSKTSASPEAAQSAADKLIAEKVKKGYREVGVTAPPSPAVPAKVVASVATEPVPAAVVTPAYPSLPERSLHLAAEDWLWATWRPRTIAPPLVPKAFDQKKALEGAAKVINERYGWNWDKAGLKPPYTPQEAHFWFTAQTLRPGEAWFSSMDGRRAEILGELGEMEFDGNIAPERVVEDIAGNDRIGLAPIIFALYPPLQALQVILGAEAKVRANAQKIVSCVAKVAPNFRRLVLPFISGRDLDEIREFLVRQIASASFPATYMGDMPLVFQMAAAVGIPESLEPLLSGWTDSFNPINAYNVTQRNPQEIIFGLGNGDAVAHHMKRLRFPVNKPAHIRAWLAHTEFSELDYLAECIIHADHFRESYGTSSKDVAEQLVKNFGVAVAPETAPPMLRVMLESKAPRAAREWLEGHPAETIHGLMPRSFGQDKAAEVALAYLKPLVRRGLECEMRALARQFSATDQAKLEELLFAAEPELEPFSDETAPEAIYQALRADNKLPRQRKGWVGAADLPRIACGEYRLSDSQIEALLGGLRTEGHPLAIAVKAHADAASLDKFAWGLFQAWLADGAIAKEKWAMLALGEIGGDSSAIRLVPLIRAWPGESQHQRAVTGLECLKRIGTDTALMQLNGIAQKVKFKGLQAKAIEAVEGIAASRGLTRSQLEDRVIPDCDLDERGSRTFDFGPRQFRFVLGPDMKPRVRDLGDKLAQPRPNLPAPNSKDDAALAEASLADWKLLKKQITDLTKIQIVRLEQAMVKGRSWTVAEFEMLLVRHPLMINLVRLLVWEARGGLSDGTRRATFRVTEDGTYADHNDETFDLAESDWTSVSLVHALNLPDEESRAWGEILGDYEIVAPFPQIGRPTFGLQGDEASQVEITRFKDQKVQPQTLCFTLEKLDWERGPALDGGGFYEHYKYFDAANATACVVYTPGLVVGWQDGWEPQNVTEIYFVPGWRTRRASGWNYPSKDTAVPLKDVNAVALSEVLKDVSEIVAPGLSR